MTVRRRVAEVVTGSLSVPVTVPGGEPPGFGEPPIEEPGGSRLDLRGRSSIALPRAVRRGIPLTVRTSAAGRLVVRALASRKTARRLGLEKRVVGFMARIVTPGRTRVTLQLTRRAENRLRHVNRVRLGIRATLKTFDGDAQASRFSVTLKRRR